MIYLTNMFDKYSLLQRLRELPFPATEYWVVAGGAMVLHGFRTQTRDIDLGCSTPLANQLERQGHEVSRCEDGSRKILYSENIELFENWIEGTVEMIDGVPVVSVDGLIQMKAKLGREKDLADIALIEKVRQTGEFYPVGERGPMNRTIKPMEHKYLLPSLALVEDVFTKWANPEEGRTVRGLVEEIRAKQYYLPELELVMVDGADEVIGYAMFSRFHIEGRYEDELLLLTPVAVKTELQRQHISKELLEYGLEQAAKLGFAAVLVEGNPRNYAPRGFQPSYKFGIKAGPAVHLPSPDCLMVKELKPGALDRMSGFVDYSFYEVLRAGG